MSVWSICRNKNQYYDYNKYVDKLDIQYDLGLIATASDATIIDRVKARDDRDESQIKDILDRQSRVHFLSVRSYAIDTEVEIGPTVDKVIRSYNASKNWKDC